MRNISLEYIKNNKEVFKICADGTINYHRNTECIDEFCECKNKFDETETVDSWIEDQESFLLSDISAPTPQDMTRINNKLYEIAPGK